MAWFVRYWDEINNRNIRSSEISAREDAMRKACSLMREGFVVSHVAGPNGERIDIVDIRAWCGRRQQGRELEFGRNEIFRSARTAWATTSE